MSAPRITAALPERLDHSPSRDTPTDAMISRADGHVVARVTGMPRADRDALAAELVRRYNRRYNSHAALVAACQNGWDALSAVLEEPSGLTDPALRQIASNAIAAHRAALSAAKGSK